MKTNSGHTFAKISSSTLSHRYSISLKTMAFDMSSAVGKTMTESLQKNNHAIKRSLVGRVSRLWNLLSSEAAKTSIQTRSTTSESAIFDQSLISTLSLKPLSEKIGWSASRLSRVRRRSRSLPEWLKKIPLFYGYFRDKFGKVPAVLEPPTNFRFSKKVNMSSFSEGSPVNAPWNIGHVQQTPFEINSFEPLTTLEDFQLPRDESTTVSPITYSTHQLLDTPMREQPSATPQFYVPYARENPSEAIDLPTTISGHQSSNEFVTEQFPLSNQAHNSLSSVSARNLPTRFYFKPFPAIVIPTESATTTSPDFLSSEVPNLDTTTPVYRFFGLVNLMTEPSTTNQLLSSVTPSTTEPSTTSQYSLYSDETEPSTTIEDDQLSHEPTSSAEHLPISQVFTTYDGSTHTHEPPTISQEVSSESTLLSSPLTSQDHILYNMPTSTSLQSKSQIEQSSDVKTSAEISTTSLLSKGRDGHMSDGPSQVYYSSNSPTLSDLLTTSHDYALSNGLTSNKPPVISQSDQSSIVTSKTEPATTILVDPLYPFRSFTSSVPPTLSSGETTGWQMSSTDWETEYTESSVTDATAWEKRSFNVIRAKKTYVFEGENNVFSQVFL